jgi:TonB family protein
MKNTKAWGVSIALHTAIAAAFFVSFSFSHELLKKDDSKEEQKLQIESVFVSETPIENPNPKPEQKQPKQPSKKEEIKEQKETPIKAAQNTQPQKTSVQEQKKEESVAVSPPAAPKKQSYSENDKKQFLAVLRQAIAKNIVYPEAARRRSLKGDVDVSFVLNQNGIPGNIKIQSGHQVFHKAVIEAITTTKITPPPSMPLPMELTLTLSFELDRA